MEHVALVSIRNDSIRIDKFPSAHFQCLQVIVYKGDCKIPLFFLKIKQLAFAVGRSSQNSVKKLSKFLDLLYSCLVNKVSKVYNKDVTYEK